MTLSKTISRGLRLVLALTLLASCSKRATDPKEQIIARVNGESVYLFDFQIVLKKLRSELDEISQRNPKVVEDLKTRALNEVIIMTMLRQEAEKKQVQAAKEEVEGRLANWKEGYPPGGFEEMLRKQNTTEALLKRRIEDQLLIEKLTEAMFGAETMVSDEEMNQYYNTHQNEFFRPPRVHAFQIVVPTVEEAKKISQEVLSGTITFESAARKYSLSPDAATGGDLGFFSRNEKIAAFNEAFALRVGEISKPIKSRYGVHLLKVVEKQAARKLKFQDAKNEVLQAIKKQKEIAVYKEWVAKMLKDGEIYRNETIYVTL
jgi:parvulin-like peptidyl-prolyl isomerase